MTPSPKATRFPRDRFTRSLLAMCEQLDACHDRTFDYKSPRSEPWYLQIEGRVYAKVLGLWAFGSWARGASECGDLDLAAQLEYAWAGPALRGGKHPIEVDTFLPDFDAIRKVMLGSRPHVHVLDLKWILEHGKSGDFAVDPESLVLVWRPELNGQPAHDWRAAIDAIKPQPQANRSPRLTDALPLLIEQTAMDLRHAENAVRAHQAGLLAWEFRPHGATRREAVVPTTAETRALQELRSECSDEALVLRTLAATRDVRKRYGARVTYWFGPCDIWATMLADRRSSAIVITPKWTQRGPNGSLVVTAGPKYSVKAAKEFECEHRV
jgi:hypothetical protein